MFRNILRKLKLILSSKISNLVQLLVSIISVFWFLNIYKEFRRFSRIIIEKTTFEEFEEICE